MSEWTDERHDDAKRLCKLSLIDNVGVMPYLVGALDEIERLKLCLKRTDKEFSRLEEVAETLDARIDAIQKHVADGRAGSCWRKDCPRRPGSIKINPPREP